METKANHVLIGLFTLAVFTIAFGFIYWVARYDEALGRRPVYIVFEGAVTGLNPGSSVLFNGIKVGEVTRLEIAPNDPERVRALVRVDRNAPIRRDTAARLEAQGLTGVAMVQLLGGTPDAPLLGAGGGDEIPVIIAEKSQFQNLLDAGQEILAKGSTLFERLDRILGTNEDSLNRSIANVEKFTDSLAANTDNINSFMKDASELASRFNAMSTGLDELIKGVNAIVGEGGGDLMKNVGSTFKRLDSFLAENEAPLRQTIENIDKFTSTLAANDKEFDTFIKDASSLANRLNGVAAKLDTLVDRANTMVGEDSGDLVKNANSTFARLSSFLETNQAALDQTVQNVEKFTGTLSENSDQVGTMIKDASELAVKLKKTSDDLDALVLRVDGLVETDGTAFIQEARKAAETFRQLAENLDERIGTATEGISRVTGRGFREFEAFVVEGRTTLRNMQRVLDRLESNPKRFLFGGSRVPEYNSQ